MKTIETKVTLFVENQNNSVFYSYGFKQFIKSIVWALQMQQISRKVRCKINLKLV